MLLCADGFPGFVLVWLPATSHPLVLAPEALVDDSRPEEGRTDCNLGGPVRGLSWFCESRATVAEAASPGQSTGMASIPRAQPLETTGCGLHFPVSTVSSLKHFNKFPFCLRYCSGHCMAMAVSLPIPFPRSVHSSLSFCATDINRWHV